MSLSLNSDETKTLNSFWNAILKGEEYWDYLFNSRFLDKLNSKEMSNLLTTHYTEDNGDIPLGYVINHFPEENLHKFLASKAYKKLNVDEEYNQSPIQAAKATVWFSKNTSAGVLYFKTFLGLLFNAFCTKSTSF